MDKSVLRKIKKLLALAASPNAHEAAAALGKAQALMAAHNLTQTAVDLAAFEETQPYRVRSNAKVPPNWIGSLACLVAEAFGVKPLKTSRTIRTSKRSVGRENKVSFVGPPERGELAAYAFLVLYRQLSRSRDRILKAAFTRGIKKRSERSKRADWFCEGWVNGVSNILNEFVMSPEERALMDTWSAERNLETAGARKMKFDAEAAAYYHVGQKEGRNAKLYRPVDGSGPGLDPLAALPYAG
jgi:hypothetical protein